MLDKRLQKKKKQKTHNNTEDSISFGMIFSSSLKGALFSLGISILMLLLLCFISYLTSDPTSLILPLSLLALYVSSFLSGFISVRLCGHSSLICGLISGGIFMTVLICLSFFFSQELSSAYSFGMSFLLHALIVIFSVLGGYMGQKRQRKTHRPKR